jgi:hypothetical protein
MDDEKFEKEEASLGEPEAEGADEIAEDEDDDIEEVAEEEEI